MPTHPLWTVTLSRQVTETADVLVYAADKAEARRIAEACEYGDLEWDFIEQDEARAVGAAHAPPDAPVDEAISLHDVL